MVRRNKIVLQWQSTWFCSRPQILIYLYRQNNKALYFIVRLFEYCLTKLLMKHFYDYQNNFKAVFLCTCGRTLLIPLSVSCFCSASNFSSANEMSQLFSSEALFIPQDQKFSTRIKQLEKEETSPFPCFQMQMFGQHKVFPRQSLLPSRKTPSTNTWNLSSTVSNNVDFQPNTTELKQRQCDSTGYIRIIETE